MMRIEAIFGGVLALFILGVAVYTLATTQFNGGGDRADRDFSRSASSSSVPTVLASADDADGVCQCYNDAFKLAGSDVGVMSAQYRTGFEQCRAVLGVEGGDAWTAGWNARLSSKPYEASCRSYRRRSI
ncbi:MAG: hypothetical protein AAGJ73_07615 [Pseudomonadota bacterium]